MEGCRLTTKCNCASAFFLHVREGNSIMSITLLLRCQDMEKTADFYRSILDFRVTISAGILTVEKYGGKIVFTDRSCGMSRLPVPVRSISRCRTLKPTIRNLKTRISWSGRFRKCPMDPPNSALWIAMATISPSSKRPNQLSNIQT